LKLVPDHGAPGSEGPAEREILECKKSRASAEIARLLGLRSGDAVVQIRRVLSFKHVPAILEDIWLAAAPFKGLTAEQLASYPGPSYALFETEYNVRMLRADEKIRAVSASHEQSLLLKVKQAAPLLFVERIAFTYRDTPMELRRGYYRTDTHHYFNTLN
jgi:GntR family transcriptional regulator